MYTYIYCARAERAFNSVVVYSVINGKWERYPQKKDKNRTRLKMSPFAITERAVREITRGELLHSHLEENFNEQNLIVETGENDKHYAYF